MSESKQTSISERFSNCIDLPIIHDVDLKTSSKGVNSHLINSNKRALKIYIGTGPEDPDRCFETSPGFIKTFLDNSIFVFNQGGLGNSVIQSFASSTNAKLVGVESYFKEFSGYNPVFWGSIRGSHAIRMYRELSSLDYIHLDHAYFTRGHNKNNYRISITNTHASDIKLVPNDRFSLHKIKLSKWRSAGEHILVCPPSKTALANSNQKTWLESTILEIKKYSDRKIIIKNKNSLADIDYFKDAWAVVTDISNVAIDSYVRGIPVVATSQSVYSSIGSVGLSNIECPRIGDRELLFNWLAYNQFSLDEIRTGEATKILTHIYG